MTDEVTPTRDAELAEVEALIAEEQRNQIGFCAVDFQLMVRVASRLRTPQVEAETCSTCGKPRGVSPNFCSNAFHLPRVEAGDDVLLPMMPPTPPEVQIADALAQADKALAVLFTMLRKVEPQGAMVADEIRGEVKRAQKHYQTVVRELLSRRPSEAVDGARPAPSRRLTGAEREACRAGANALLLRCQQTINDGEWGRYAAHAERLRALASRAVDSGGGEPPREFKGEGDDPSWTYPIELLDAIKATMPPDDFAPSLEAIELALIGYERVSGKALMLPPPYTPPAPSEWEEGV